MGGALAVENQAGQKLCGHARHRWNKWNQFSLQRCTRAIPKRSFQMEAGIHLEAHSSVRDGETRRWNRWHQVSLSWSQFKTVIWNFQSFSLETFSPALQLLGSKSRNFQRRAQSFPQKKRRMIKMDWFMHVRWKDLRIIGKSRCRIMVRINQRNGTVNQDLQPTLG